MNQCRNGKRGKFSSDRLPRMELAADRARLTVPPRSRSKLCLAIMPGKPWKLDFAIKRNLRAGVVRDSAGSADRPRLETFPSRSPRSMQPAKKGTRDFLVYLIIPGIPTGILIAGNCGLQRVKFHAPTRNRLARNAHQRLPYRRCITRGMYSLRINVLSTSMFVHGCVQLTLGGLEKNCL